jgi:aspartate aminotransferase
MNSTYLAKELESEAWIDFQDCDPFGHLNNARYLNYFMRARTEQLKASYGFDLYEHTAKTGNGWVVGETHLAYLLPAKFNETVKIKTRLLHYDSFRLVPEAFMLSQDGKRVHALGWIEFIYVNSAKGRPVKYDEALQSLFSAIIVGTGGKQVLYNFFLSVINDGDEVVCPAPYWVSYKDIVRLAGGTMKLIHTTFESGFKLSPQDIENNVSGKTKVFILNSPSNPTGATYTPDEIRALAVALEKFPDLLIVTDDIYEKLAYGTEVLNIATASEKLRPRTVIINGLSKAYSMTGWRLGYAGGPKEIIAAMDMIQGQSTSNATSFSQKGAVVALNAEQQCVEDMRVVFEKRRDLAFDLLSGLKGLRVFKPQGAFYLFPDIAGLTAAPGWADLKKRTGENDTGKIFSTGLLNEKLVAVVPGSAFGYENGFRISYATSEAQIEKGLGRVREFIEALWA